MDHFEDIFESPLLQYKRMKKALFQELILPSPWGEQGSKERIVAISRILKYLKETRD